ncbi:hypothetical protein I4U23_017841 [Adineta vaga]|nr:hypothetical protein I4U23_017841 [Adineta vaga]
MYMSNVRLFHSSSLHYDDRSKVEKTVTLLKKDTSDDRRKTIPSLSTNIITTPVIQPHASLVPITTSESTIAKRKSVWHRIVHELKHYYNGFILLFIETKIAFRLLRQVLQGHTLTRRERKQFARTVADLFRLVPFSVFIIVPFMEFTLPIFLKLFPNMLPSTFKAADKEKVKLKKQMKVKLEVAKFLQDTLEATALTSKRKRSDEALPAQFVEFMKKVRSTGVQPSTEEIMKFSSLFENKSTLDNLNRPQLVALCQLIGISTIGPEYYLRFTLHLKLRHLAADDKLIEDEGIESLNVEELQAACRERGMRSFGVSIERLRSQLQQWLDLHLNKRIPSTILLLSRALYLPENVPQENILKAAIQSLPKAIDNMTAVKLAQLSGEPVDNTQRIEYIKHEEKAIRKEQEEKEKIKVLTKVEMTKKKLAEQVVIPTTPLDVPKAEILVDRAPVLSEMKTDEQNIDVGQFETALEHLLKQKAEEVFSTVEDIRGLKADVKYYKEDVKQLGILKTIKQLKHLDETYSAKALSKHIDRLVGDLDQIVQILDKKQKNILKADSKTDENTLKNETSLKTDQIQQRRDFLTEKINMLVSTQELVNTIRQIQKVSNNSNDAHVWDIIYQFDHNRDGFIEADEILKALEIVDNENVQISRKHLKEILDLMNFSELFKVTSRQSSFSPDGEYLACVNQYRLIIRSSTTLEIINLFACIDTIETIEWSYDSRLVLAGLIKRNAVQVFSLDNPEWKCKIDEGSAGLCNVHWAPDSRHILTTAQFHLRITVWSLASKNVSYIKYPKKLSPKSYVFSLLKPYMALVERRNDSTDHISIFDYSANWSMIAHFQPNELEDLQGIEWSPIADVLCLWENSYEYKIVFYTLDGQLLNIYKAENDRLSLGVRCARWSPTGQVIAVGDYEERITIFSYLTYKKIQSSYEHPQKLSSGKGYTILKEEEYNLDGQEKHDQSQRKPYSSAAYSSAAVLQPEPKNSIESKYIIYNGTLQIAPIKPDLDRANPRLGVSSIEYSCSGRYLSTINDTMPNLLFIFDFKPTFHLAFVLIQTQPIRCVKWEPKRDHLALCTHNNRIYIWSPQGASCINLPDESTKHNIDEIKWNNVASSPTVALIGQDSMCIDMDTDRDSRQEEEEEDSDGDDLDFYDFLEDLSDKIDSITNLIEERKQDSRQRWQRKKDEIDEKKRLLRLQLETRIHNVSEKLKKPDFIRTRDKITFTVAVANTCFSPLIAGQWPHLLPLVYTIQALFLITLRFFIYKHKHWHYFIYDLCYFVNVLTLIYIWILPSSEILFLVCYTLTHGPLALAIILWKNSLVFHSFDKVTSIFIHMYPPLTMFTLRWLLPIELQIKDYPAIAKIGNAIPMGKTISYTIIFYLIWQALYYIFIVYGRRDKVESGSRITSYTWLLNDKKGFVARLVERLGFGGPTDGINIYKIIFYFLLQFTYMFLAILPVCLWYYRYMYINGIFLCSMFAVSVYNGASFYIEVFSRQYIKSLELLQGWDDSSSSTQKSSIIKTDNNDDQEKKHS